MPTAREIEARIRKEQQQEAAVRKTATLTVVRSHETAQGLRTQLAQAELDLAEGIRAATEVMSLQELARFSGLSEAELRQASKPTTKPAATPAAKPAAKAGQGGGNGQVAAG